MVPAKFKIKNEKTLKNGFRRADVDWSKYKSDFKVEKLNSKDKGTEFKENCTPAFRKNVNEC